MILSGVQTSLFESPISHFYDTKYWKLFPKKVVDDEGIEPSFTESESIVLPLNESPLVIRIWIPVIILIPKDGFLEVFNFLIGGIFYSIQHKYKYTKKKLFIQIFYHNSNSSINLSIFPFI